MMLPIDTPDAVHTPQPPPSHPLSHSPPAPEAFRWIPIRSLAPRHRPRILAHLLSLPDADRHLRFGHSPSDTMVARYVDQIDFDQDEVFGVFNRRLEVTALAHLAYLGPDQRNPNAAEFAVSVKPGLRGRGVGARMFEHAVLRARNRQVDTLVIHALSENAPMLRIVRRAGAHIVRDGPDSTAHLGLPAQDFASHVEALTERQAAEFDYSLKVHARRLDALIMLVAPWRPGPDVPHRPG